MPKKRKYPTLYVKNFAKIKEAEIELAPFTLFIGDNNSGKSYLASLVWYIQNTDFFKYFDDYKEFKLLNELSANILDNENFETIISNDLLVEIINGINNIFEKNKNKILSELFDYDKINIDELSISKENIYFNLEIKTNRKIKTHYDGNIKKDTYYLNISYCLDNEKINERTNLEIENIDNINSINIKELFSIIFNSDTLFLPVSRTGFILLKDLIDNRGVNSLINSLDLKHLTLTLPVKSYLSKLDNIKSSRKFNIHIINNKYIKYIVDFIEKNILHGNIQEIDIQRLPISSINRPLDIYNNSFSFYSTFTNLIANDNYNLYNNYELRYKDNNSNIDFQMHVSSAVVTELTSLILFLKYYGYYKNIIMEEPEISLHPSLQQQLTRAFIKLVNSGKNVLITTHSDTIVQHINNMIKLNANEKEKQKELMEKYKYDEDDIISEDKIRMYQFDAKEDGTEVRELESSKYGFETPTFHNYLIKVSNEFDSFIENIDNSDK